MSVHIKDFLPALLGLNQGWKVTLLKSWPTVIGSLQDKVILEKIENDTVTLGVVHPAWIQELSLLKPIILQGINDQLEKPYIKNIRIKTIGFLKKNPPRVVAQEQTVTEPYNLSLKEERALEGIKDSELKEAMRLFLQRCVRSK